MDGSLDAQPIVVGTEPPPDKVAARDDVLVLIQSRAVAGWSAFALAAAAAVGAGLAATSADRSVEWWLGAAMVVLGIAGFAVSLAAALRPARLTVSSDGLDLWQLSGARSMAWEELAAVGHSQVSRARGKVLGASGVRIVLLDGTGIDLPAGWGMDYDDLIELITDAWQGFTGTGTPTETSISEGPPAQSALVV